MNYIKWNSNELVKGKKVSCLNGEDFDNDNLVEGVITEVRKGRHVGSSVEVVQQIVVKFHDGKCVFGEDCIYEMGLVSAD